MVKVRSLIGAALTNELVEPLVGHRAFAVGVDVRPVAVAGRRAVDGHAKAHRLAVDVRPKHQMQVAGMEAIDDRAVRLR